MPETLELTLRPTGPDSMSWSVDGSLAIAAATDLHILFPRSRRANLSATDPTVDTDEEWEHIYFEIASYPSTVWPVEIWPRGTPSSFFLAREQRLCDVVGVQWSPPGMASHERCVLGVLTSNGFLSVIKPGGMERAVGGWKRACVISPVEPGSKMENATILPDPVDGVDPGHVPSTMKREPRETDKKILVVDGQIRGWAWAPAVINAKPRFWMVVVTETSLYAVRSTNEGDEMVPTVEAKLDIPIEAPTGSLEDEVQMHQHGCHVLWHTTEQVADSKTSYILLSFHGHLRQVIVQHNPQDDEQALKLEWAKDSVRGFGPLAISSNRLFYGHKDDLHSMVYEPHNFPLSETLTASPLQGWDPSFAMRPFSNGVITAQPLSLASYTYQTESDGLCTSYFKDDARSHLAKQIASVRDDYAAEHDLDDATTVSLHGIATYADSTTKTEWLAAIISLAPSNQIQYKMKTNERVSVIFTHKDLEFTDANQMAIDGAEDLQFPWFVESKPDLGPDAVHSNTLCLLPTLPLDKSAETKRLVMMLLFESVITRVSRKGIDDALRVLKDLDDGEWEKKHGTQLKDLDVSTSGLEIVNQLIQQTHEDQSFTEYVEHCTIPGCGSPVKFVDGDNVLDSAACESKGHQFARCALTLLAIQQPYISKQCEGCLRTFLDEEKVNREWKSVKTIADQFKRCPYCGSKFVG